MTSGLVPSTSTVISSRGPHLLLGWSMALAAFLLLALGVARASTDATTGPVGAEAPLP